MRLTPLLAALSLGSLAAAASAQSTFTDLGQIGNAGDLSGDGKTVVGYDGSGAWYWTAGTGKVPIGGSLGNVKVSRDGAVIMGQGDMGGLSVAARWTQATGWVNLGGLPGGSPSGNSLSTGYDISGDGSVIVGLGWVSAGTAHAFRWTQATGMVDLSGLQNNSSRANAVTDDGTKAVGWDADPVAGVWRPALWPVPPGPLVLLAPGNVGGGQDVSDDGSVVVGDANTEAFRWTQAGGLVSLGLLPGQSPPFDRSAAYACSADGGTVLGQSGAFGPGASDGFVWRGDFGMERMEVIANKFGANLPAGWRGTRGVACSDDGLTLLFEAIPPGGLFQPNLVLITLPPEPVSYCTAKLNSLACLPTIGSTGVASASATSGFNVTCDQVINQKAGLLFYSLGGRANTPFQQGILCVATPIRRTPAQNSGGSPRAWPAATRTRGSPCPARWSTASGGAATRASPRPSTRCSRTGTSTRSAASRRTRTSVSLPRGARFPPGAARRFVCARAPSSLLLGAMLQHQVELSVTTPGRGLVEVTDAVSRIVREAGVGLGTCVVFCRHTSCSLLIQENADPSASEDLLAWLERLAPDGAPYYRHSAEGPDDMPAHLRAAVTRTSETIPVRAGDLALGTWQGLFLAEHRLRGSRRTLIVHVTGQPAG